jgi:predicted nucleic acid-binding protein
MTVFADTFAMIAWLNPRDNAHAVMAAYLDGFTGRLVTTEWVLMELADALSRPEKVSGTVSHMCDTFIGYVARKCGKRFLTPFPVTVECAERHRRNAITPPSKYRSPLPGAGIP